MTLTADDAAKIAAIEARLAEHAGLVRLLREHTRTPTPDDPAAQDEFHLRGLRLNEELDTVRSFYAADACYLLALVQRLRAGGDGIADDYDEYVTAARRYNWTIIMRHIWDAIPPNERRVMLDNGLRNAKQAAAPHGED